MKLRFDRLLGILRTIFPFPVLVFLVLASGCKTPQTDWNARIGSYTYDQAVMEFGPPDKQAHLDDGVIVAEWLTQRGYSQAYVTPPFYPGYCGPYYGPVFGTVMQTSSPSAYLRLIFGNDHKLQGWKQYFR